MEHVLWIGGPPGSGKTTLARRLAVIHGLRYLGADRFMQAHHARGVERGLPAMTRWEELTPDERWLADPEEMAELSLAANDERWSLLLEDVRRERRSSAPSPRTTSTAPFLEERPDLGTPETLTTRFVCECGAERDFAELELTLAEYAATTAGGGCAVAPDHRPSPE